MAKKTKPEKAPAREQSVTLKLSGPEYQLISYAASKSNARGVNAWMRTKLVEAAKEKLSDKIAQQILEGHATVTLQGELRVADVEGGTGVKVAALADEQLGVLRIANQIFVPAAVPGIEQGLASSRDPVRERNIFLLVRHAKGEEFNPAQGLSLARG